VTWLAWTTGSGEKRSRRQRRLLPFLAQSFLLAAMSWRFSGAGRVGNSALVDNGPLMGVVVRLRARSTLYSSVH